MQLQVLYFGVLKDVLGSGQDVVELPAGSSAAELVRFLRVHRGSASVADNLWSSIAIAVNQEYVRGEAILHDGDEVALLPPVSGGWDEGR